MRTLVSVTSWMLVGAMMSCSRSPELKPVTHERSSTNQQTFAVKGTLTKLEPDSHTVTIQHEEVTNYMPAMTMPFTVKNTNELQGLMPGDSIVFQLHVTGDESWIDQIQKAAVATPNEASARPSVRLVRDVEPLHVGDLMPDYRFTNELGRAVSLSDFKGKALTLTFIFTRCPLPEFCPLMSRRFAAAQKQLSSMPNAPINWHFLSISFDPHFDTPAVLKGYAQIFKPDSSHWSFVTGAMIDIDAITEQFDLPVIKQGENWEHKLRTIVIDANGRIQKIFPGNQWTEEELVTEILKAASARKN